MEDIFLLGMQLTDALLNKKIFLLNPVPVMQYTEEIEALQPIYDNKFILINRKNSFTK